jgi:hypothetical protein
MVDYANAEVLDPVPPGPWCNEKECICGGHIEDYRSYNSRVTFDEAAARLRQTNRSAGIEGGGYRSRGPILHMMSVMKLERFYDDHAQCDDDQSTPKEWADYFEAYDGPGARDYLTWYADWKDGYIDLDFEDWIEERRPKRPKFEQELAAWQLDEPEPLF